ncbi:exopolysaccharide biosynthesis polyprenyl glycosylphosphotransferase [Atopomonas hussainii]|uniref:exopolysaccharide biosynthesis polyprenyl glycosylphosphotransferase n=1 Tax=Atopomonas hussainii TaxID=1429083 RepID=UPI0009F81114|nr:exopolysaccharide biosynthesis polyprenyl glycosylphosphotransferase [Atopomonas hussainii]
MTETRTLEPTEVTAPSNTRNDALPDKAAQKPTRRFDAEAMAKLELLLLRLIHGLSALAAAVLLYLYAPSFTGESPPSLRHWAVFLGLFAMAMPVQAYKGLSASTSAWPLKTVSALINVSVSIIALQALLLMAGHSMMPPPFLLGLTVLLVTLFLLGRALLEQLMSRLNQKTRLVILGAGEHGVATAQHISSNEPEMTVIGFIEDRQDRIAIEQLPAPLLGNTAQLDRLPPDIDGVVIALPNSAGQRVNELSKILRPQLGCVYLAPEVQVLQQTFAGWPSQGPQKMMLLGMNRLPIEGRLLKRIFDIGFASCALLVFFPLGLIIALAIKIESPGPVLFKQQRFGLRNQLFSIYKFRSMRFNPDGAQQPIQLTERGDSRVTRVGNFLRRTSLDEFPQFLNVLLGQMSVVGPRPHPPGVKAGERTYEAVVDEFIERYKVRPGITGWAQVNGARGNTFTETHLTERFSYDAQYIQNWSIELDVWIVLKTVFGGFGGKNAF